MPGVTNFKKILYKKIHKVKQVFKMKLVEGELKNSRGWVYIEFFLELQEKREQLSFLNMIEDNENYTSNTF